VDAPTAVLAILVAIAILFEVARRSGSRVIDAQRAAVIELRDRREINDQTLRAIERELDLEEIRMEG
jgi:hypothetical protein